jgi:RNA polymerase sigma factor (sigma-70 family)
MKTIRVLIADDHPIFRFGMKTLLSTEDDIEVVGEANTGQEAVNMVQEIVPDVILMDINMPGINGIEATRAITETTPETAVLIVTMLDDESVYAAMRSGARGYLLKGAEGSTTLRAIRAVADGETILSSGAGERLQQYISNLSSEDESAFPSLTPREREILELIAQGLTNNAIAEKLVLSPKTVRNQVSTIFRKLQVTNRGEAIALARDAGYAESR